MREVICAGCKSWRVAGVPGEGARDHQCWYDHHVCSDCQRIQDADVQRYILHIGLTESSIPEELLIFPAALAQEPYYGSQARGRRKAKFQSEERREIMRPKIACPHCGGTDSRVTGNYDYTALDERIKPIVEQLRPSPPPKWLRYRKCRGCGRNFKTITTEKVVTRHEGELHTD